MKAYIGPYRSRWTCQIHYDYMNKKYDYTWEDNHNWFERALEKLESVVQSLYNVTINLILDRITEQTIKVRIDKYDTWSMDHTLAHIVVPMLKQLHATKHGAPFVDDEDVPEHLRQIEQPADEVERSDENFERLLVAWNWVMDEMIWAFEQKLYDWEALYYEFEDAPGSKPFGIKFTKNDEEGRKAHQARMNNGFRLFGKYYEALWD